MIRIVRGDAVAQPIQLTEGAQRRAVPAGAEVTAGLYSSAGLLAGSTTTLIASTPGSDWTTGLIVLTYDSATTANFTAGKLYSLEIQIIPVGGEPITWQCPETVLIAASHLPPPAA